MARPNDDEVQTPHVPGQAPELEDGQDLSLAQWLARDDSKDTGKVRVTGGRLTIAVVTEDELETLQEMATSPDPRGGRGATKFDATAFKRFLAAYSLAKAETNGDPGMAQVKMGEILPALTTKLAGDVLVISQSVARLSGFDEDRLSGVDDLVGNSA